MLAIMDMSTGRASDESRDVFEIEFGQFKDEVLNAGWMPPSRELQLGLHEVHASAPAARCVDVESFLSTVYRNQR